jgi:hypothetical protein
MSQSVTSSLYVKLVADAGDWESGMAAATSATQKFEAAAKKAARSPGLQSSIGSGEQAQIRKALELRQRYAGMGGDVAGPVRVTDKMVSDESERIILNRLVRSRNAEEQRAAAASAASNHIIMVQKSEAEAFALSERKKELAISLVNQAIANATELERQQALVTANAIAQTEAKKQAAIEQTAAINARMSEAMALQRGQVLAGMTAPSGNKINAQTSMLVQQAELEAKVIQETEAKKQVAIEQTAKVAAINAKIATVSSASRFENANPFAQQVLATQRLNALLAQRRTLTDEVARAQNRLAVTEQVADVRSIRANLTAGSAVNRLRNLGSTAADNTGKYARFGVVLQQAGYQVQDFAVQVAGGQNALVAMSQQGSQMLGVFGVGGAIAGAVLSVGILAYRLASSTVEVEKHTQALDRMDAKLISISKQSRDFNFSRKTDIGKIDQLTLESDLAQDKFQESIRKRGAAANLKTSGDFENKPFVKGLLEAYNMSILYVFGITRSQTATKELLKAEEDRVDALVALGDAQTSELRARDEYSNKVIQMDKDRIEANRSEGESELYNLIELEKQKNNVRTVEYQNAQSKIDQIKRESEKLDKEKIMIGEKDPAKFKRLQSEMQDIYNKGLENTNEAKRKENEINTFLYGLESESEAIKDQLDLKRALNREQERMNFLVNLGFLTEKEVNEFYKKRAEKTVVGLQSKVPESLGLNQGALSSGLLVGGASPSALIDISQQILAGIRQLVNIEYMGQRSY